MRRYVSLLLTAALSMTAGLAFHRVFGFGPVVPVAVVAAVIPTALSATLAGPRSNRPWPLWISVVLTTVAWAGTVSVTVLRASLTDGTLPQTLRTGVLGSWKSILTTLLPAPAKPEFLVLVHVLTWLAAFASAELALRTRFRALPALPPLGTFAVALMLGVDGPGSNLPLAAATIVLTIVLILVRSDLSTAVTWRPILLGLPTAAALGALAFLSGPYVPVSADPYNPREQVAAPPPQQRDSVSPLDRVAGWLQSPAQVLFTARSSKPERWRLAVLDQFNGVTWTSSARFVPTGSRVPTTPASGSTRQVTQQITIKSLPGVYVPAADRPRKISGLGVSVDPSSGALAAVSPLRPGQTYTVDSRVREDIDDLPDASAAQDAEAQAALTLPNGPGESKPPVQLTEFRSLAQRATAGASSAGQQAAKLAEFLKTYAKYDVTAPPGHSYRQLDYFLGESRRGTPEHFATAYALLARTLGLPTRVVVGFAGTNDIKSGDVLVWPEVKFADQGWVPFNPMPQHAGRSNSSGAVAAGETQKIEQAQKAAAQNRGPGAGPHRNAPAPGKPAPQKEFTFPTWAYAAIPLVALLATYLLAVLLLPALRKRRRRSGPPAARIAGAWHQALEHLSDVGLAKTKTLTAHEVARYGTTNVGTEAQAHLRPLADLVNQTHFSGATPDDRAAAEAWEHTNNLGRLVTAKAGRTRRLRRRLHPRTLRPR
ncbi:hypothetical protein J4573_42190 [Actinomadura barringtoniae]|uniref:Transglutaminase-like domain-containing protein n=1 Tax=Actinomadura barringtoniae TaxID=1427535 RepID=A0A939TEW2_9ACTN|nr:DUF3488 and transglutaminase-like domain-containing protein [Actinomadura barringtoniae]MBO2453760.1 hypothetical protein [Actinomadura barringtoniae]